MFAELNRGEEVTKGLRKVDKSEMTHKNPALRASSVVPAATPSPPGEYLLFLLNIVFDVVNVQHEQWARNLLNLRNLRLLLARSHPNLYWMVTNGLL